MWVEALDKGDLKNKVPNRDRLLALKAPFTGEPREVVKTEQRFMGLQFFEKGGRAFIEDSERQTRRVRTFQIEVDDPGQTPKLVWSRNAQDRYKDPGTPMLKRLPSGGAVILQDGDSIFLTGLGAGPKGDHPFLDRYNIVTGKTERLFQCDDDHYEVVDALLDDHGTKFLTRRESPTEPPNYFVRTADGKMTAMTNFPDPQPIFRKIKKQLVTYKRADGVPLSFDTLSAARLQARHAPAHPHLGLPARIQRRRYRRARFRFLQALHRGHRLLAALPRARWLRRAR